MMTGDAQQDVWSEFKSGTFARKHNQHTQFFKVFIFILVE